MNYLIQLINQWRCRHNWKYVMRITTDGKDYEVSECQKCQRGKYELLGEAETEPFKDLGAP